jgi:hypothetical protein
VVTTSGDGKSGTSNGFDINTTPACAETATGTGAACLNPDASVITTLTAVSESSLPREGKPNIVFPHGFFSFRIAGLALGARVTVTMTLPSPVPVGTQYWKYGPTPDNHTPHWYQLPIGDDDGDNVITITLTDNGLGDDILTGQDGQIVDQGGPGIQRDPGPTGGPVGGVLMPVNKPAILVPYIVLFGVVTTVAVVVVVPSKKRKN